MTTDYNEILSCLTEKIEMARTEKPSAGTKYRLMGLVADITEVAQAFQQEVLAKVSQEAVLDADTNLNYAELSEQILTDGLSEQEVPDEGVREQILLVNEALGFLGSVLTQIADQLERRHKDEEYERLYEAEKRRYLNSGMARRARQTFEQWKDYECSGCPQQENIEDYRMEKLLKMFEKGVLSSRVEHIQRAKRYPDEVDFEQLDDDHPLKKSVFKHYAALRKLVDYRDGFLVVDAVRVGRHFYACRHEDNAKANRTSFLKYMHKVELAQEECRRLQAVLSEPTPERSLLPEALASDEAMRYWGLLRQHGFVDEHFQLLPDTTRKQAMYVADIFSDKLQMRSKWKAFQDLWHINNLAQEKWEMQETGKVPARSNEIDSIFME